MPILLTAVASVVLAWLRGAPPTGFAAVRLRWLALPLVAFVVQFAVFIRFESALAGAAPWLHVASMALLLLFVAANLSYRTLALVAAGIFLNLAVIAANGGYMPVRVADMERAGFGRVAADLAASGHFQKSGVLDERTHLPWLADIIHVPLPNGPDRLISIGDVLIAAGAFLFVQEALVGRRRQAPPDRAGHSGLPVPAPAPAR
jgi:hypothetical protein